MKYIDFHTHFYTQGRSAEASAYLLKEGLAEPDEDGELKGLIKHMKINGIEMSVNLPVAMSPADAREVNLKAVEYNKLNNNVISLGTMHHNMACDAREEAEFLKDNGIRGIKMNPQELMFYPDERGMAAIYEACVDNGLFILMHAGAGAETGFDKDKIFAHPKRFRTVIDAYPELKLVLAHMGGLNMWDEAREFLLGRKVYFDTAYTTIMPDDLFGEFIKIHGSDKVLFGSDFPWQRPSDIIKKIFICVSGQHDRDKIFYANASAILSL